MPDFAHIYDWRSINEFAKSRRFFFPLKVVDDSMPSYSPVGLLLSLHGLYPLLFPRREAKPDQ